MSVNPQNIPLSSTFELTMPRLTCGMLVHDGLPNGEGMIPSALGQWEATGPDERVGPGSPEDLNTLSNRAQERDYQGPSLGTHCPVPCYALRSSFPSSSCGGGQLCPHNDVFTIRIPQWIPVRLTAGVYTNTYSSAFLAAHGLNEINRREDRELEILRRAAASDSAWDSLAPTCHPGTRKDALRTLYGWASEHASTLGSIFCLQGPAGVGKSVILRTLTQGLHCAGRLGGMFTFRRNLRNGDNAHAFFPTMAYQLAMNISGLRGPILRIVRKNPHVVHESMSVQVQELILKPSREVTGLRPLILVVDGIAECSYEIQREILCLLGEAARIQPLLRILVASRREQPFAAILAEPCFSGVCQLFNVERSFDDVRTYFSAEFERIQYLLGLLPAADSLATEHFVQATAGCFLYASMLVAFLSDPEFYQVRRRALLENPLPPHCSPLDDLYRQILGTIPPNSRDILFSALHILTTDYFANLPLHDIQHLLGTKPNGALRDVLRHLDAVLEVPKLDSGTIGVMHASFFEFIVDETRSGQFCVGGPQYSENLVRSMLRSLAYTHEDSRVNRKGHVAWTHLARMVEYITSISPSPDLVPLAMRINPDFFFGSLLAFKVSGRKIISWLRKIQPQPVEAIRLWEDYEYMAVFHSVVSEFDFDSEVQPEDFITSEDAEMCRLILLQHRPFIRLLRTALVLPAATPLYPFRLLLGASWEDLRTTVCALRPIFPTFGAGEMALWLGALQDPEFAKEICPWGSVFTDLARRSVRIVKGESTGAVPSAAVGFWLEWGRYVRSSSPCLKLLDELRRLVPPRDDGNRGIIIENEIHDVLKWLQSFAVPPQDEIVRWTRFLAEGATQSDREWAYEARWTSWRCLGWYGRDVC